MCLAGNMPDYLKKDTRYLCLIDLFKIGEVQRMFFRPFGQDKIVNYIWLVIFAEYSITCCKDGNVLINRRNIM